MWLVTLSLFVILVFLWLGWRKKKLSFFEELGIPGPKPNIFFGNYRPLLKHGQHNCFKKWIKQYGRVFGYYYGLRPVLVIADPDILTKIQMKDFQKFSHRPPLFRIGSSTTKFNRYSLTTVNGKKWKELRSIITPTFTTAKMKSMIKIMYQAVDELSDSINRNGGNGKYFDIYKLYQNLTLDVIARTSLGIQTKAQQDPNEPFLTVTRQIFDFGITYFTMLAASFPEFISAFSVARILIQKSKYKGKFPRADLSGKTSEVVKLRREDTNYRRNDLLQLLIDARKTEGNINDGSLAAKESDDIVAKNEKATTESGVKLSDEEVTHNAVLFLLAGYETTSTALAFTTHLLIHHQDVQDKAREEIRNLITKEEDFTYENVQKLTYLDRVLKEALRLFPPIIYFINREAVEDVEIEGLRLPKGTAIQVPVYHLHHDEAYWEDPEKFDPDRFSPGSSYHPMAYQPFGAGPRNCVGLRFAQLEAKLALAKILHNYKLLPKPGNTKDNFQIQFTTVNMRPEYGVIVKSEKVSS